MISLPSAWIALIGAMFGGAGIKTIEHYLSRPAHKETLQTEFRRELREEVTSLREELSKTETDLEVWKEKYYLLMEATIATKAAAVQDLVALAQNT